MIVVGVCFFYDFKDLDMSNGMVGVVDLMDYFLGVYDELKCWLVCKFGLEELVGDVL